MREEGTCSQHRRLRWAILSARPAPRASLVSPRRRPKTPTSSVGRVRDMRSRSEQARAYREKGRALTRPWQQPTEGSEKGSHDTRRAQRGIHHGGKFVGPGERRLDHERVAVYTSVRGQLERSECPVLRRASDGLQLHEGIWRSLPSSMGDSRSLARMGTVTSRKEWLHGARLESVAKHPSVLRVVTTSTRREHA